MERDPSLAFQVYVHQALGKAIVYDPWYYLATIKSVNLPGFIFVSDGMLYLEAIEYIGGLLSM